MRRGALLVRHTALRWGLGLALGVSLAQAASDLGAARSAYEHGDFALALVDFRELAAQGSAAAAYQLGLMHANGEGVAQDHVEAVRWYRKAAAKGNADAQRSLGMCFAMGQGVTKDLVQAAAWLNLAVSQGDTMAERLRQRLDVELTSAQAAQAATLARQWNGQESVATSSTTGACEGVDAATPVPMGDSVTPPRLVRRVEPVYPLQLRASRLRGHVTLRALVDASGDVRNVEIMDSQNPSFSRAAVDAVKKWKYDAAKREGCTVPVALMVSVDFNGG